MLVSEAGIGKHSASAAVWPAFVGNKQVRYTTCRHLADGASDNVVVACKKLGDAVSALEDGKKVQRIGSCRLMG